MSIEQGDLPLLDVCEPATIDHFISLHSQLFEIATLPDVLIKTSPMPGAIGLLDARRVCDDVRQPNETCRQLAVTIMGRVVEMSEGWFMQIIYREALPARNPDMVAPFEGLEYNYRMQANEGTLTMARLGIGWASHHAIDYPIVELTPSNAAKKTVNEEARRLLFKYGYGSTPLMGGDVEILQERLQNFQKNWVAG